MDSQKTTAFIPELVQEVADFKKFLQAMNTTVLISLLDLEKCISSNSMLKKMATIWGGQLCGTRFVLKLCIFEAVISYMVEFLGELIEWLGSCCGCRWSADILLS